MFTELDINRHAEGIDPGVDKHFGKLYRRVFNRHGYAQLQQGEQHLFLRAEKLPKGKRQMIPLPVFADEPGAQQEADALAENSCQRRAFLHDKNDIQHNIQQRRKADEIKRMLRVAHAPQNRTHRIVPVNKDNACHGNAGIGQGLRERFGRRMHQFHDLAAEQQPYPGDAAGKTKQRRAHGGNKTAQLVMLFSADVLGDQHLSRTGKAHGDKRHAVHDVPAYRNSGKPHLSQRLPYYDHVRHIVDDLQQMGQEHRHGKTDKLPVYISRCKIRNQRMDDDDDDSCDA